MEIVVYMLKKGINTLEEIADSTDLSLEQVKKIKEEQKLQKKQMAENPKWFSAISNTVYL